MKYKVGDKVKYDGGEWWFCGTVIAEFEHSDYPFYRIDVERKEKKNTKFSVNQFETELEAWEEEVGSNKDLRKWKNLEIEYLSKALRRSPLEIEEKIEQIKPKINAETKVLPKAKVEPKQKAVQPKVEPKQKAVQPKVEPKPKTVQPKEEPKTVQPKVEPKQKAVQLKVETKQKAVQPKVKRKKTVQSKAKPKNKVEPSKVVLSQEPKEKSPILKRGEAWRRKFEMYQNGEKSQTLSVWLSQNRQFYREGILSADKIKMLEGIGFDFNSQRKISEK